MIVIFRGSEVDLMNFRIYVIPIIFIIVGFLLMIHPPKFTHQILGYKTPTLLFINNESVWYESNRLFGKLIMIGGGILIILIKGLEYFDNEYIYISKASSLATILIIIISIVWTEICVFIKLRKSKNKHNL